MIPCIQCGKDFKPPKPTSKACSFKCDQNYRAAQRKKQRDAMDVTKLPKGPAEALRLGERFYYTGVPCERGHVGLRRATSGKCCDCRGVPLGKKSREVTESLQTVSTWLHILPNWQPVVVRV